MHVYLCAFICVSVYVCVCVCVPGPALKTDLLPCVTPAAPLQDHHSSDNGDRASTGGSDSGPRLEGARDDPQLPGRPVDQPPNPSGQAAGSIPSSAAKPAGSAISNVMAKQQARVEDILRERDSARKVRCAVCPVAAQCVLAVLVKKGFEDCWLLSGVVWCWWDLTGVPKPTTGWPGSVESVHVVPVAAFM